MDDINVKYRFRNLDEVTPEVLKSIGVDALGLDIDNTLAYDSSFRFVKGARELVSRMKRAEIPVIIVSNTFRLRASIIAKELLIPYVGYSRKPLPNGVLRAAEKLGVEPARFALLGDQLFADVQAANRAGAIPLLVDYAKPEVLFKKKYKRKRAKEREMLKKMDGGTDYYVDK